MELVKAATSVVVSALAFGAAEKTSTKQLHRQIRDGLKETAAYHPGITKEDIKEVKEELKDDLSSSDDSDDVAAALNEANARLVLGKGCELNRLPGTIGSLNKKQLPSRVFSIPCQDQIADGDGSGCGWRAALYAYFIDHLSRKGRHITSEALNKCIYNPRLPKIAKIPGMPSFRKLMNESIEENGSTIFMSKIRACIKFMLHARESRGFEKQPKAGKQAEDYHLRLLAQLLGIENFNIVHYTDRYIDLRPKNPVRDLDGLLHCAGNPAAKAAWINNYRDIFAREMEQIRDHCTREQFEWLVKNYANAECIRGIEGLHNKADAILAYEMRRREGNLARLQNAQTEQELSEWAETYIGYGDQMVQIEENRIREQFRHNAMQSSGNLHFVCHMPGHWFLITVRKEDARSPVELILDSLNNSIAKSSEMRTLIHYVYDIFVKPFEPAE